MARITLDGLAGPSNRVRSPNVDVERTVNFYTERPEGATPKVQANLYGTPGTLLWSYINASPVRGLFSQDNRTFAVAGTQFVELFASQAITVRGTVTDSNLPAQMVSNGSAGNQIFLVTSGLGYIFDLVTNILTLIADVDFPPDAVNPQFIDGYFVVQQQSTRRFQISALEDGTSWDALDVAERSIFSDNIAQIIAINRGLWLLGTLTSEKWYNTGDPLFPFAPDQGVAIRQGCVGALPAAALGDTIYWIGQNPDGMCIVYRLGENGAQRISTHAVEKALKASQDLVSTISWVYQQEGHSFYCLYVPDLETQWTYDTTTGLWHEFALWNPVSAQWEPDIARCACSAFERILIGDPTIGAVMQLRQDVYAYAVAP